MVQVSIITVAISCLRLAIRSVRSLLGLLQGVVALVSMMPDKGVLCVGRDAMVLLNCATASVMMLQREIIFAFSNSSSAA